MQQVSRYKGEFLVGGTSMASPFPLQLIAARLTYVSPYLATQATAVQGHAVRRILVGTYATGLDGWTRDKSKRQLPTKIVYEGRLCLILEYQTDQSSLQLTGLLFLCGMKAKWLGGK